MAKKNFVSVSFETVGTNKHIVEALGDAKLRRDVADDLGHMLLDKVNEYVPESNDTSRVKLKTKGYRLKAESLGKSAKTTLVYRNTGKLPYVMYQYYGIVYGKNWATFSAEKFNPHDLRMRSASITHDGWVSKKGAHKEKTKRLLGHPARNTITLKDGRVINITGYTKNKNAQHKWLEYVRNTSTIWYPLRQEMVKYVKAVYGAKTQEAIDKRETMRRNLRQQYQDLAIKAKYRKLRNG